MIVGGFTIYRKGKEYFFMTREQRKTKAIVESVTEKLGFRPEYVQRNLRKSITYISDVEYGWLVSGGKGSFISDKVLTVYNWNEEEGAE